MKTVGIVGNSHIAALRLGWKAIWSNYPGVELVFFGKPLVKPEEIKLAGDHLVAASDELAEKFVRASGSSILPGTCDGYVICDLGISAKHAVDFCKVYRPEGYAHELGIPISQPCFEAALYGIFKGSFAVSVIGQVRTFTGAPIALIPAPMRSVEHPDADRKRFEENGDAPKIAETFNQTLRKLADNLNLRLFLQTGATLESPLRTKQVHTRAHARIKSHEASSRSTLERESTDDLDTQEIAEELTTIDKDYGHMSGRYGAIVLRLVLDNFGFNWTTSSPVETAPPAAVISQPNGTGLRSILSSALNKFRSE
jgi:hypothetical protein